MKHFTTIKLLLTLTTGAILYASPQIDEKVIAFEKERFLMNQNLKLQEVSIKNKKPLNLKGWYGYTLNLSANVPGRGIVNGTDMLFSNGEAVATELLDMKGRSFKDLLLPQVDNSFYQTSHLIAGDENAPNKVVVFSDPLCPACQQALPTMIQKVQKNANTIALYYYHFPLLSIHPAALTVSEAMEVAKDKGIKNLEEKLYQSDFRPYFDAREQDRQKILDGFNTLFSTTITLKELDQSAIKQRVTQDIEKGTQMMVQGTPTIFVNGKNDKTRQLFAALGEQIDSSYYKKSHLIAGDENAPNKVVVFSDPLCPACQRSLPAIIHKVNSNTSNIALYYYHFPLLSLHPAALTVSQAMEVAKRKGVKNLEMKLYLTDFQPYFNAQEEDKKKILDGFNAVFNTNITLNDISTVEIKRVIDNDIKAGETLMVRGTPTLFVNGKEDSSRQLFNALGVKQ